MSTGTEAVTPEDVEKLASELDHAGSLLVPLAAAKACYSAASALRELRAYRKEGWVLVPKEPTPEMCAKGFCVSEAEHDPAGVYRAMIAAAPEPQEETDNASNT